MLGWLPGNHVHAFCLFIGERNATYGRLRVFFNSGLCLFGSVPMAEEEAAIFHAFLEFFVVIAFVNVSIAIGTGLLKEIVLNVFQQVLHAFHDTVEADVLLFQGVTPHDFYRIVLQVATAHHETHRYTFQFVVGELETGALVVRVVVFNADT